MTMPADTIRYSKDVQGDRRNYRWPVRFSISTGGYLGINQTSGSNSIERVLLSPKQVKALLRFLDAR